MKIFGYYCNLKFFSFFNPAAGGSVKNIEKNIYSISTELQSFSDSLLQVVKSGNLEVVFSDVSYEYSVLVEKLWKDKGFLATYARRDELSTLPMVAEYFLSRVCVCWSFY